MGLSLDELCGLRVLRRGRCDGTGIGGGVLSQQSGEWSIGRQVGWGRGDLGGWGQRGRLPFPSSKGRLHETVVGVQYSGREGEGMRGQCGDKGVRLALDGGGEGGHCVRGRGSGCGEGGRKRGGQGGGIVVVRGVGYGTLQNTCPGRRFGVGGWRGTGHEQRGLEPMHVSGQCDEGGQVGVGGDLRGGEEVRERATGREGEGSTGGVESGAIGGGESGGKRGAEALQGCGIRGGCHVMEGD